MTGPHIEILDGEDFASLDEFFAFDAEFGGGVSVD